MSIDAKIQSFVQNIPDYKAFLTVSELNDALIQLGEEYPDLVEVFVAGHSRKGEPIYCAKIGKGSRNALMFGCPHPNEPIGAMMLHYFSRGIVEDAALRQELDFTWYIMPVSDVDGTKLNEKWFKGPYTLYNYARNYFRPAGYEQVEWTFPMQYKKYTFDQPIPETQALMKLIDEIKPAFMYSLHNSGFGGAYWYISKNVLDDYTPFHKAAEKQGIPIDLGEPEVPYAIPYAPAVYKMISAADNYDYLEKYTDEDPVKNMYAGASSTEYAGDSCVTLVTEVPYFFEPRVDSAKEMPFTREEAANKRIDFFEQQYGTLIALYDQVKGYISEDNPFAKMVDISAKTMPAHLESERNFVKTNEDFKKPCKESEALSNLDIPKFSILFIWGLLIRSIEFELEKGSEGKEKLEAVLAEAETALKNSADEAEKVLDYSVIPIKKLLSIQLECGLEVAKNV